VINARAMNGDAAYGRAVDVVRRLPGLPLFEAIFVFAPLALHGVVGLWMTATRTPLRVKSPYPRALGAWMRATGIVAFAFVLAHIEEFRAAPGAGLGGTELGTLVAANLSSTWMGVPWKAAAYLIGSGCVTFHFAAGAWAFFAAATETESAARRKWTAWTAGAVGVAIWATIANVVVFQATGARFVGDGGVEGGAIEGCPAPPATRP
jgi:succinate dehydrogenase/fumarate reductase cytochrome b subunit